MLTVALASAVGSWSWYGSREHTYRSSHRDQATKRITAKYAAAHSDAPDFVSGKWEPPTAQTRGREWIYDLFTPPEIFYDPEKQRFVASRPNAAPESVAPGLELVAVQRTPFRLQLVGYVGDGTRYLGTFENQQTGEVILTGAGRALPALGLMITAFSVERRPVASGDRFTPTQWVATAVVRDVRTGEFTRLIAGERSYTDELRALLASEDDGDEPLREFRTGEEVQTSTQSYILDRLQLDPPAAELTQIAPAMASSPIHFSLTPRNSLESLAAQPAN